MTAPASSSSAAPYSTAPYSTAPYSAAPYSAASHSAAPHPGTDRAAPLATPSHDAPSAYPTPAAFPLSAAYPTPTAFTPHPVVDEITADLQVRYEGRLYPADEIARGAAYELLSNQPAPGFLPSARRDAPWHRFVPACEVDVESGPMPGPGEAPLMIPLSRRSSWEAVHQLTQTPHRQDSQIRAIRESAAIRRGTRMIKVLSARQVAGFLKGWLPAGFCYREWDVAHLRTPDELRLLRTDADTHADQPNVAFALRWRAIDPLDYDIPTPEAYPGLVAMPSGYRIGSPVLGTGFTPSSQHIIPEYVTASMADLPLSAHASIVGYTPDGQEATLFTYQPEQRGWLRMAGPQWRGLLAGLGSAVDQEYLPLANNDRGTSRLVGTFRGAEYDTVADPPEFRVLAMTRAARYPVESLSRRTRYASWRGVRCTVVSADGGWVRLRLSQPDSEQVVSIGAQCHERGIYEAWAPAAELTDRELQDTPYPL